MNEHIFDKNRWQAMTIFEQMGNIGSEVGRALNAKKRGDEKGMNSALWRGLDLIDASVEKLVQTKSPQTKEFLRAREQFAKLILTDDEDESLEKYFMEFAIVARLNR